jgi:pimeloyl-ACP methyl ester carboxylesterase
MSRVLLVLVAVVVLVLAVLWAAQRRLIYLPDGEPPPARLLAGPTAREVSLPTADGLDLRAWLVGPTGPDRRVHVLFAPGNAGNRAHRADLGRRLAADGFTVLLLDYRGYGGNPGSPAERGLAEDVRAARRFLVEQAGAHPSRLLYVGESLGAAVVTELAVSQPPAGLVLRSPFRDLASVGQLHYPMLPVRLLLRDRFDVLGAIQRVSAPTIVVYGTEDRVVPPAQSEAVAAVAPNLVRSVRVPGADHNDPALLDGNQLLTAIHDLAPGQCP